MAKFKYPEGQEKKFQHVSTTSLKRDFGSIGKYELVLQELVDDDKMRLVRFGYYRTKPGTTQRRWGSQTTFCFSMENTIALLAKACREDGKWRAMLKKALRDSKKS